MLPEVGAWLARRSGDGSRFSAAGLAAARGAATVSVVIPARDEEATVGAIVATIRRELVERVRLVDELLVVDSRSTDATAAVAAAEGARVVAQDEVLPHLPAASGKGEALWKGLAASTGDLVVFVDGDLRDFDPGFVTGLLGPLLTDPGVAFVKGFHHRPLMDETGMHPDGGGRVTELVARPLINLLAPRLAGFVQPLGGEYAGRRAVLERVPFVTGYGVEIGLLFDLLELCGLDALAQVDLGVRLHRHQDTEALGRMSAQIMLAAHARLARRGMAAGVPATSLVQFRRGDSGHGVSREVVVTDVAIDERPSLHTVRHPNPLPAPDARARVPVPPRPRPGNHRSPDADHRRHAG